MGGVVVGDKGGGQVYFSSEMIQHNLAKTSIPQKYPLINLIYMYHMYHVFYIGLEKNNKYEVLSMIKLFFHNNVLYLLLILLWGKCVCSKTTKTQETAV